MTDPGLQQEAEQGSDMARHRIEWDEDQLAGRQDARLLHLDSDGILRGPGNSLDREWAKRTCDLGLQQERRDRCPRCDSPTPRLHPAIQYEGEVSICRHPWHQATTTGWDKLANSMSDTPTPGLQQEETTE